MSRPQFLHDKINNQDELDSATRQCLSVIGMCTEEQQKRMNEKSRQFYQDICKKANLGRIYVTQKQLNWLRDITTEVIK